MGFAHWMRVLDTLGGLAQLAGRFRRPDDPPDQGGYGDGPQGASGLQATAPGGMLGQLETRLTGVLVAALKEAFDRDSARLELERSHIEAERRRAEEALRAELMRQAADRVLAQLRLVSVMGIGLLGLSAGLMVLLPGMRDALPRGLLGGGWLLAIAALGASFAAWQQVSAWSSAPASGGSTPPSFSAASAAPWLLIAALVLTALSLLTSL